MNYEDWTEEQKVAHVLEALSRKDLSAELAELIQGWIICGEDRGGREGVMDAILDRMFNLDYQTNQPSSRTVETLADLHEKLGLPKMDVVADPDVSATTDATVEAKKRFP